MPNSPEVAPSYPMDVTVDADPSIAPHPDVENPVLTPADVTDRDRPTGVADPFLAYEDGTYHMFFEVLAGDNTAQSGVENEVVGHAVSEDGLDWEYTGVVLDDPGHLALPHVFNWRGTWYMLPDSGSGADKHFYGGIARLYRAESFPTEWRLVDRPVVRLGMSDPVVFLADGTWYLVGGLSDDDGHYLGLCLYHADGLVDAEWVEHPASPLHDPAVPATDPNRVARPGGRPVVRDDAVDLFVQDCTGGYGEKVRAYRITDLSPETYADAELRCSPVVEAQHDGGWRDELMHHVDAGLAYAGLTDVVAVDGMIDDEFAIGLYQLE
jgi:hypothetical protein